jgi:acyl-coenzyme A synthetase/AMP-(fatty) acid ligase/3-hydroxymyristoyl/3-hydroxydecanoyl-(acyl carrier protein) dehydratase
MADVKLPVISNGLAVIGAARAWTWHEIHAAAAQAALRLPAGGRVCNLCASRVGFLVWWLAALRRGCLQLLPPSGGRADLVALLDDGDGVTVVVDDETLLRPIARTRARCIVYLPQHPAALPPPSQLAFEPDLDRHAFCLYTSGTTGEPQPQLRTLRHMVHGAEATASRLDPLVQGGLRAWRAIVCSVPPQHMFGFETSVLLSWVTGIPVLDSRPLLPLDVRAAMQQVGGPLAWIATPLHLRALAQSGESLPDCRLALVSTMPLAATLAEQVESLVRAPVLEIFGSTETGALATRRTARERYWLPLAGVRLEQAAAATVASGAHFPSPQQVADEIELRADGSFEMLGRHADMVKIGGRRTSLSSLNLLLQELPGLRDGVLHLPSGGNASTPRLVLLHAGPLERQAAQAWLRERIDPVFMPRQWIQLARLPRDANGKLARAELDALCEAHRNPSTETRLDFDFSIPADHPALPGHFPGRPVVPGVLILDVLADHLRAATAREVRHLRRVKFISPLLPGEPASVRLERRGTTWSFQVSTAADGGSRLVAEGRIELGAVCAGAAA